MSITLSDPEFHKLKIWFENVHYESPTIQLLWQRWVLVLLEMFQILNNLKLYQVFA